MLFSEVWSTMVGSTDCHATSPLSSCSKLTLWCAALAQSRPLLWRELAKSIPGRSNKDCRRRWWNSLADGTTKGSWAEEEDERLIEAVRKRGTNWSKVARDVGSRNSDQCASHWSQVLDPDINFCDWTTEEVIRFPRFVVLAQQSLTDIRMIACFTPC